MTIVCNFLEFALGVLLVLFALLLAGLCVLEILVGSFIPVVSLALIIMILFRVSFEVRHTGPYERQVRATLRLRW